MSQSDTPTASQNTSPTELSPEQAKALRASRIKMVLIFLLFAFPLVGSTALFYLWRPDKTTNYGELITPAVDVSGSTIVKQMRAKPDNLGRWILIQNETASCTEPCKQRLQLARNVNVALNKYSDRMRRIAVVNAVPQDAAQALPDTQFVLVSDLAADASLTAVLAKEGFLLVDANNFAALRYPLEFEGRRVIRDLNRLLKNSIPQKSSAVKS